MIVHDLNCPNASGQKISNIRADANYAINRDGWTWCLKHPKEPIDVILLLDGNNERLNDDILVVLEQYEDPEWDCHNKDCPGSYVAQEVRNHVRPSRVRKD